MTYIPLPSKQMMESLEIEAKLRKIQKDNEEEFEKGLKHAVAFGIEAYRISPDGKVTFLTKEQYEALWQNSQTNGE